MATTYTAYPTMRRFHDDYSKYTKRFVAGSPGSGKSVGCAIELLAIAMRQEPTPRKIRYTKFAIIRSTYGELERTTLETLKAWLPPAPYTQVVHSKPIKVRTRFGLSDGTTVDIQFDLIAIKDVVDLGKLDSYEATAIWLNEMTGLPAEVVGKAGERVGRYPPSNLWDDGKNHCTYYGVIGDYNYPDKDHWLVGYLHEGELPEGTMLYEQPPALLEKVDPDTGEVTYEINPKAENLVNLNGGKKYLEDLVTYQSLGKYNLIQTRLLCRYGKAGGDGKAVFTNFDKEYHVAPEKITPAMGVGVLVSIDTSGIHPCALIWQCIKGKWTIVDGMYAEGEGFQTFVDDGLIPHLTLHYANSDILCVCDPANARGSIVAITPIDLLNERGLKAIPAKTNAFKERLQAGEILLSRRDKGSLSISPHITWLIDALDGGYQYRKIRIVGAGAQYTTQPLKNEYSHWADAFQYGALHIVTSILSDSTKARIKRLANASFMLSRQ